MADKSPKKDASKKVAGKSLKEKRADKHAKASETSEKARVEEGGHRHHGGHGGEGERKIGAEAEDVREDLLGRDEEAEDRPEHQSAGDRVAGRLARRRGL